MSKYYASRYHDTELITAGVFFAAVNHGYQEEWSMTRDLLLTFAIFRLFAYLLHFLRITTERGIFMKFEVGMDTATLLPVLIYFFHFINTYWDGYNAPLPKNEVCRKGIYCGVAVFFKWFVFVATWYYLAALVLGGILNRGGKEWFQELFNDFTKRDKNAYYIRRYYDVEFIISIVFIIGFRERPRIHTSATAILLLLFAIFRLTASIVNIIRMMGKWRTPTDNNEMDKNLKRLDVALDLFSYFIMALYLGNFSETYRHGYSAPLPYDEVCTGGIYCGMVVYFKWYVFFTAIYYALWAVKEGAQHASKRMKAKKNSGRQGEYV